jgi:hypothetical protein
MERWSHSNRQLLEPGGLFVPTANSRPKAADPVRLSSLRLRQKRQFENPFKPIWPSSLDVKICACAVGQITGNFPRVPCPPGGAFRDRHERWTRDAMDAL